MHNIRCLIADDERYARDELRYLISSYPHIEIVAEVDNGEDALVQTLRTMPHIVFLDIEMPKQNGIEIAKAIQQMKEPPLIVFATAYPQFAVDAFRIAAVDYLLKPYDEKQLAQTMERIENHFVKHAPPRMPFERNGRLSIEQEGEITFVPIEDIYYICREENMTKVYTMTKTYEIKSTLKELENKLEMYAFFRVHKSFLVNLHYVSRLVPWFNGAYHLELAGLDNQLSVSRNYVKPLRQQLELF